MADATTLRYIYPPDWDYHVAGDGLHLGRGGHQGAGWRKYILHLTNISDGTGESAAVKVDLANIVGPTGRPAVRTVIEWIEYDIFGIDVTLYWERIPANVVLARLPGGATIIHGKIRGPLYDPGTGDGTDGSGNILLTTTNHASGDSYDIRICVRPKERVKAQRNAGEDRGLLHVRLDDGVLDLDSGLRK